MSKQTWAAEMGTLWVVFLEWLFVQLQQAGKQLVLHVLCEIVEDDM